MIYVVVPHAKATEEVICRESPWGTVEQVRKDIWDWLIEQVGEAWDFDYTESGDVSFSIEDHRVAVLFKLVWG